jgi:hypothetical protein
MPVRSAAALFEISHVSTDETIDHFAGIAVNDHLPDPLNENHRHFVRTLTASRKSLVKRLSLHLLYGITEIVGYS